MINSGIIYENDRIVVIATGINGNKNLLSSNSKTGPIVQTWILAKEMNPIELVKQNKDSIICGSCPLKKGGFGRRACYVAVWRAPYQIWKAYNRGKYPALTLEQIKEVFVGKYVRFGSYGEPTLIPYKIVEAIINVASGFTGYTHGWKRPIFQKYSNFFMASTTPNNYLAAQAMGWRTFTMSNAKLDKQVVCPASNEAGKKSTCQDCGLCKGNAISARSIQIQPHGIGKYSARKLAA